MLQGIFYAHSEEANCTCIYITVKQEAEVLKWIRTELTERVEQIFEMVYASEIVSAFEIYLIYYIIHTLHDNFIRNAAKKDFTILLTGTNNKARKTLMTQRNT